MPSSPSVPPSTAIIARPPKAAMPDDSKPMERPEALELSRRGRVTVPGSRSALAGTGCERCSKMDNREFRPRIFRDFAGDYRPIDNGDDRLSPLGAILLVGFSIAL